MPLRLDNAIALPTCPQQLQKKKAGSMLRFQIDHAARPRQKTNRPERLATGRDQIGKVGEIVSESVGDFISVRLGDFVGIRTPGDADRHENGWAMGNRGRRPQPGSRNAESAPGKVDAYRLDPL